MMIVPRRDDSNRWIGQWLVAQTSWTLFISSGWGITQGSFYVGIALVTDITKWNFINTSYSVSIVSIEIRYQRTVVECTDAKLCELESRLNKLEPRRYWTPCIHYRYSNSNTKSLPLLGHCTQVSARFVYSTCVALALRHLLYPCSIYLP